ncbi:flagellar biosynthetic protein FliR [Kineococcus glutinatus]|uniref:Flagellar biosynthetic protein FliR n=1 Tax=Kineococcus glutinatus TaxID=1070872 RepID=A0ABP9I5H5_9ACTN
MQGTGTGIDVPLDLLLAMLLSSVRVVSWMMLAPPFSNRAVNGRVKAMVAVAVTLPLAVQLRDQVPAAEPGPLISAVLQQALVGAVMGALCALAFAAVQAAGDLLDLFGGFQMASAYDPLLQNQTAIFGKLYQATSIALLVVTGGHLIVLQGLLKTFEVVPLTGGISMGTASQLYTEGIVQMVAAALQIAAPLIAVLFITDIGLGLLSRAAPALNAFSMSFPLKIMVTLTLGGFAFALLPGPVSAAVESATGLLAAFR